MLVSQAEYARQRVVSRQYVGQMVAKGVITLQDRKVDPAQADAALAAVREPARPARRAEPQTAPVVKPAAPAIDFPVSSQGGGDLPMNREDIADFLGVTTETVSRTFSALRKLNIIGPYVDRTVKIIDRKELERIAEGP